jgi:hypothetical protein
MSIVLCLIGSAVAGMVKPSAVESSSFLVSDKGEAYEAKALSDGKLDSVWLEGADSSGLGSWVKFDLGGTTTVTGIKVWNGYWVSQDFWSRHNRVKDIEVEFSDGTKEEFTLTDAMSAEQIRFKTAKATASIKVKFKSVYRGSTFNDTGFSEIQVLDQSPSKFLIPSTYAPSSTLVSDGDGNYDAVNLHDGIVDSMWCEGNADGDGTGESITFDFGTPTAVSKLQLRNGSAGSFSSFMAANRANGATLTFSDGSSTDIAVKTSLMPQTIMFPSKTTSQVVMTFTGVVKGSQYNDLCISEATFSK